MRHYFPIIFCIVQWLTTGGTQKLRTARGAASSDSIDISINIEPSTQRHVLINETLSYLLLTGWKIRDHRNVIPEIFELPRFFSETLPLAKVS